MRNKKFLHMAFEVHNIIKQNLMNKIVIAGLPHTQEILMLLKISGYL